MGEQKQQADGLWIIDSEGNTLFASEAMASMLRTSAAEMVGRDSFGYLYDEDVAEARRLFAAKQAGSPAPFHFRLRRADGTPVWVDVLPTPMYNAAGRFNGVVGTFTVAGGKNGEAEKGRNGETEKRRNGDRVTE